MVYEYPTWLYVAHLKAAVALCRLCRVAKRYLNNKLQ